MSAIAPASFKMPIAPPVAPVSQGTGGFGTSAVGGPSELTKAQQPLAVQDGFSGGPGLQGKRNLVDLSGGSAPGVGGPGEAGGANGLSELIAQLIEMLKQQNGVPPGGEATGAGGGGAGGGCGGGGGGGLGGGLGGLGGAGGGMGGLGGAGGGLGGLGGAGGGLGGAGGGLGGAEGLGGAGASEGAGGDGFSDLIQQLSKVMETFTQLAQSAQQMGLLGGGAGGAALGGVQDLGVPTL
ncbi:hypothetical protein SAMN05444354_12741 [Stigmatella aurantiaca]|uniref:Uncharacterized protein n=1 Tax=Stigmatella aurantiaca TaxID=41 RepID=A0A1H8CQF4_STIAU|nr:hypothetical protein [Stigmatella aurantiaca]SEM97255.1 hypothetical protein SAMN05444354_12741 [Stigmatella aurantiaca]